MNIEYELESQDMVTAVAAYLILKSQWFEITPLPDDRWRITVKSENIMVVSKFIKEIKR